MKKIILLTLVCLGFVALAAAQDKAQEGADPFVNKRGIALLPVAGDFALGIDAAPFLQYVGNIFNGTQNNAAPFANGINNTIYAKYFLEDKVAIRAKLGLRFTTEKYKQTIPDDYARTIDPTNLAATAVDVYNQRVQGISLNVGYEMRRGKGRVQGFYGGEARLGYSKVSHLYDYGNAITENNQNPTTFAFMGTGNGVPFINPTYVSPNNANMLQGYRMLKSSGGTEFRMGVGAFAGVEYFFAPQISIGAEFTLALEYSIKGQDNITSEGYVGSGVQEFEYRARSNNDNAFYTGLRTTPGGFLFLMFHF